MQNTTSSSRTLAIAFSVVAFVLVLAGLAVKRGLVDGLNHGSCKVRDGAYAHACSDAEALALVDGLGSTLLTTGVVLGISVVLVVRRARHPSRTLS